MRTITRRGFLASTAASAVVTIIRVPQLPAAPIELPPHEPSEGYGRKLWVTLGSHGDEIVGLGREPVTFRLVRNDRGTFVEAVNEKPVYFTTATRPYLATTFHLFDADGVELMNGPLSASIPISKGVLPSFEAGALALPLPATA